MILQAGEFSKYSCFEFYLQPHYESFKYNVITLTLVQKRSVKQNHLVLTMMSQTNHLDTKR